MSEDNINGPGSMKAVKNPGKLNTSMWETGGMFGKTGGSAPKKKKTKKTKKKKSKLGNMWEDKLQQSRKEVNSTQYVPKKKVNKTFKADNNATSSSEPTTATTTNGTDAPKKINKVSALAGKIAFNPMGLKGGIPPSLLKKREEQKENGGDIPEQQFEKPTIPAAARKKGTKINIVNLEHDKTNQNLRDYLSESFMYDEAMIINETYLLLYLRDIAGIDLSSCDENYKWDTALLLSCLKEVYGDKVQHTFGYKIKAI